jgi:alkanesulfonate monooxygenase SsuD/methylene tetrahydromethanopterin reductase-like flavin-dependent oxidoreductase (luciferase family)
MTGKEAAGGARSFRFGVVAPLRTDLPAWRDQVRRIADSGFSTLLMPDVQQWQPAPGPTLAVAATLADLRVGTWVYASPLRRPWSLAWEAHSLSVLTEGRFEMGIGTGRPGIEDELRELGLPVVTPGRRLSQVRDTVTSLRELDGPDLHTPVVMAVRGPKAQALAGRPGGYGHVRHDAGRLSGRDNAIGRRVSRTPRPRTGMPRGGGRRRRLPVHDTPRHGPCRVARSGLAVSASK